jgi:hypothetical protein
MLSVPQISLPDFASIHASQLPSCIFRQIADNQTKEQETFFSEQNMTEQKIQDVTAQGIDEPISKHVADRFGMSGFRTEKFVNDDEDSSLVDRCSDSPAVMEAFEVFHNAAMSCQLK